MPELLVTARKEHNPTRSAADAGVMLAHSPTTEAEKQWLSVVSLAVAGSGFGQKADSHVGAPSHSRASFNGARNGLKLIYWKLLSFGCVFLFPIVCFLIHLACLTAIGLGLVGFIYCIHDSVMYRVSRREFLMLKFPVNR